MLRNRKEQEQKKLTGVNRVADPSKLQLGMFESLQNLVPAKRYKIKKKRGVVALVDSPPIPVVPSNCGSCPSAVPAVQNLPVVCCFVTDDWGQVSPNCAGSISHIAADGTFWVTVSEQSGFPSGPYPVATPTQTWYLLKPTNPSVNCDLQEQTAVTLTGHTANFQATQTAQAGVSGKSDEKSYHLVLDSISPATSAGQSFAYFGESSGSSILGASSGALIMRSWAKEGNRLYSMIGTSGTKFLANWVIPSPNGAYENTSVNMETAIPGWNNGTDANTDLMAIHYTSSWLYLLIRVGGQMRISRINKTTLIESTFWNLTGEWSTAFDFSVFNDDLMFMIRNTGTGWNIGYFQPSTTTSLVLGFVSATCNSAGLFTQDAFHYKKNFFYIGAGGAGTGDANVLKIGPLLCPGTSLPFEP